MPWLPLAIQIASVAAAGYGTYAQGRSAEKLGVAQQKIVGEQAISALEQGDVAGAQTRRRGRELAGEQRVALSAGRQLGTGSALDIETGTETLINRDAVTIHNDAMRRAWGLQTQGDFARWEGKTQGQQSVYAAGGTIIGGASDIWADWKSGLYS